MDASKVAKRNTAPLFLTGLKAIANRYDGYIFDVWGVLHNGVTPFPRVIACLQRLSAANKKVALLSNAPRRAEPVAQSLEALGVPRRLYHGIVTSGEDTYRALAQRSDPWYQALGNKCFHIGHTERRRGFLDGINLEHAPSLAMADFILLTGPLSDAHQIEDYESLLQEGAALNIPLICVNPDLSVVIESQRVLCAGSLAQRYEELGGCVRYHGKPYAEIYAPVFKQLAVSPPSRILAVGDALATDIKGAETVGIDSALVCTGMHEKELGLPYGTWPPDEPLAALCAHAGVRPTYVLPALQWSDDNNE